MTGFPNTFPGQINHGCKAPWIERLQRVQYPAADKAGIVLHGMLDHDPLTGAALAKPTHYVVAPWSQGRFSDGEGKLYFLAKGSVDAGEGAFEAALRESYEETGVSAAAIASGVMPGVQVVGNAPLQLSRTIEGSSGHPWRTQMFFLELEQIDRLQSQLKNPDAQMPGAFAENVAPDSVPYYWLGKLPAYVDMLYWLRSGTMPIGSWNDSCTLKETGITGSDTFVQLEHDVMQALIAERKARGCDPVLPGRDAGDMRPEILNPVEFGIFRDRLTRRDCEWLDARLKQMKNVLTGLRVIGDDHSTVKIDMKERPLQFYQEGADLLPMSEYLTRMVNQALENARYDRNMMGLRGQSHYKHGMNHHLTAALARKEIAMLAPVMKPQDIDDANIPPTMKLALRGVVSAYQNDRKKDGGGLSR